MDYPARPLCPQNLSRQEHWSEFAISSSRGSSQPSDQIPAGPALASGFFTTEPPRKPDKEDIAYQRQANEEKSLMV